MADGRWRMAFACGVLLLAACKKAEPPAPPPAQSIVDEIDLDDIGGPNLLSLARGASVVSRTAEQTLETSAVHAMDGDWLTFWRSPPGGPEQTFVFSLPARARIDRIGVITSPGRGETPPQLRFEASDDGVAWREIQTLSLKEQREPQIATVPPFEASYLRVQTIGTGPYYTAIRSLIAKGQEIAQPKQPPVEGCWQINGMTAHFVQQGTSVAGVIGNDPPMYVLGGANGRTIRLTWLRGAMWGLAIITLDPARRALSGERWHETVRDQDSGDGWFGVPCVERRPLRPPGDSALEAGAAPLDETEIAAAMLKRAGKWTAYGESALDTIAALIARAPSQRFEIHVRTPAMRDALRKRGLEVPISVVPAKAVNEPQRAMADGVVLHAK